MQENNHPTQTDDSSTPASAGGATIINPTVPSVSAAGVSPTLAELEQSVKQPLPVTPAAEPAQPAGPSPVTAAAPQAPNPPGEPIAGLITPTVSARTGPAPAQSLSGQPGTPSPQQSNPAEPPAAPAPTPASGTKFEQPVLYQSASEMFGPKRHRFGGKWFIILLFLLLAGAGAAAGAYYGYYLPNKPENVVKKAFLNEFANPAVINESGRFEGRLSLSGGDMPKELGPITFEGAGDGGEGFLLKATISTPFAKPTFELRSLDRETVYLKVGGLKGLSKLVSNFLPAEEAGQYQSLLSQLPTVIEGLNDQWMEIGGLGGNEAFTRFDEDTRRTVAEAYQRHPFLSNVQKQDTETLNGRSATRYRVNVEKRQFEEFVERLHRQKKEFLGLEESQLKSFKDFMEKQDLNRHPFDLWISDRQRIEQFAYRGTQSNGTGIDFRLTVTQRAGNVTIQKPQNTKSVLELLGDFAPLLEQLEGQGSENSNNQSLLDDIPVFEQ